MMVKTGSAPRTEFRSHLKKTDSTGKKTFKPYTHGGRTYSKPLRQPFVRWGPEYGYNTNPRGPIKKAPSRANTGKVVRGVGRGLSRFAAPIGLGLVVYNIKRHGVQKTAHDELKFNWSISPTGLIDEHLLGNRLENYFSSGDGYMKTTVNHIATMALLEAIL